MARHQNTTATLRPRKSRFPLQGQCLNRSGPNSPLLICKNILIIFAARVRWGYQWGYLHHCPPLEWLTDAASSMDCESGSGIRTPATNVRKLRQYSANHTICAVFQKRIDLAYSSIAPHSGLSQKTPAVQHALHLIA